MTSFLIGFAIDWVRKGHRLQLSFTQKGAEREREREREREIDRKAVFRR